MGCSIHNVVGKCSICYPDPNVKETAIKYNTDKLRVHLCPPFLRNMMISALEYGCKKYFENSWRKGFLVSDMYSAANRHMDAFFHQQEDLDEESQCHHLDCAIFSIAMMRYSVDIKGMDDRPPVTPEQIAEVIRLGMIEIEKRKGVQNLCR
jgi:hypothetical protein